MGPATRPPDSLSAPPGRGLELDEDLVEAITQVSEDMVTGHADTVLGVESSGSLAHPHGAWPDVLKVTLCCEETLPVRGIYGPIGHVATLA